MTVETLLEICRKTLDVLLLWGFIYFILKSLQKNVKMVLLVKGILIIILVKLLADWLNLVTIGYIIDYIIEWAPLAIIVILQPEIRETLERLGRTKLLGRHKTMSVSERKKTIDEIVTALDNLKKQKMGALIVMERDVSLANYIDKSQPIYAKVTAPLLTAIFFVNNPLHDGGVIIQGDEIACANSVFPTTDNLSISKRLGTRHRAGIGISERSDCLSIILSEETGRISLAENGNLMYNLSPEELKVRLLEGLSPAKSIKVRKEGESHE